MVGLGVEGPIVGRGLRGRMEGRLVLDMTMGRGVVGLPVISMLIIGLAVISILIIGLGVIITDGIIVMGAGSLLRGSDGLALGVAVTWLFMREIHVAATARKNQLTYLMVPRKPLVPQCLQ